jgi:hypothetical protein
VRVTDTGRDPLHTGEVQGSTPRRRNLILVAVAVMLAGCSENEQLAACVADTEPTVLLRQLNLDGVARREFNECVALTVRLGSSRLGCQAAYLGRATLLSACMKRNGYAFALPSRPGCLYEPVDDPECFRPKWLQSLRSVLASD